MPVFCLLDRSPSVGLRRETCGIALALFLFSVIIQHQGSGVQRETVIFHGICRIMPTIGSNSQFHMVL